jgi:hypothetical protein
MNGSGLRNKFRDSGETFAMRRPVSESPFARRAGSRLTVLTASFLLRALRKHIAKVLRRQINYWRDGLQVLALLPAPTRSARGIESPGSARSPGHQLPPPGFAAPLSSVAEDSADNFYHDGRKRRVLAKLRRRAHALLARRWQVRERPLERHGRCSGSADSCGWLTLSGHPPSHSLPHSLVSSRSFALSAPIAGGADLR